MNLADPELELVDPTPNVHSMFLHFDRTFFWAKLSSRCVVRWSKRMYSCAGICSYEGRGGLCDIALSEPLLKLRPRKDLVETLLHEMIHAFLFVTGKDQNRDGHGPNFQAHMHRINRAAGLNISIYHDFHDEVKLYQTHWWRCEGPCQTRRPHFGIVRRTCNRAPGPSDYWWSAHKRNCGGNFIKIKEPEKPEKAAKETKGKKTKGGNTNADITKYINNNNNKEVNNKNIIQNNTPAVKPVLKDMSNVPVKSSGIKSNNSSTLVVTKKNVIFNPQIPKPKPSKPVVFSGTGQTINGECKRASSSDVVETVRNVWANKQLSINNNVIKNNNNSTPMNPAKHKSDTQLASTPPKIKKIDDYFKTTATSILKDLYGQDFNVSHSKNNDKLVVVATEPKKTKLDLVSCPVCNIKISSTEINRHLDECLNKSVIKGLCEDNLHDEKETINKDQKDKIFVDNTNNSKVKTEAIIKKVKEIVDTVDLSSVGFVNDVNRNRRASSEHEHRQSKTNIDKNLRKSYSFITNKVIENSESLSKFNRVNIVDSEIPKIDSIKAEPSCSNTELASANECPCCGNTLNKSVDEHLDECLSFFDNNTTIPEEGASTSFGNETIVIEDDDDDQFDETLTMNATGTKLPCPCCFKMVEEVDMNNHLDKCLS